MTQPILNIKDLTKIFNADVLKKKFCAVDHLSLSFEEGKVTGLLGHNGAGKTTTIRMILGLIRPNSGLIEFRGKPISYMDRRVIGYMPETNRLPQSLTPEEALRSHLNCYAGINVTKELIANTLEKVGLEKHKKKKIKELSKGLGRRIAWALATTHDPDFLILDEPMSGLDPLGRAEFSEWILELRQRNKAILLCMHELEMIDQLCDEVVMLARGRLVYSSHDEGVENRVMWLLSASGISRDSLDALTSHLPACFSRETVDLAHKFWFKDQQVALKWLKTLSTEGVLIQEFKEDHSLYLNKLLALYKGIAK
jgi:ABC-2 type transport system ATP-binding protein